MMPLFYSTVEKYGADVVTSLRASAAMWQATASKVPLSKGMFPHEIRNSAVMAAIVRSDCADRLEAAMAANEQTRSCAEYEFAAVKLVSDVRSHAEFVRKHCPVSEVAATAGDADRLLASALKAIMRHEDVLIGHSPQARNAVAAARLALIEAAVPVIDLDHVAMEQFREAARDSNWIPPEYMGNDWQSDVCRFLREGPSAFMPGHEVSESNGEAMRP